MEQRSRPTLAKLAIMQTLAPDSAQLMSISDAQKALWVGLQNQMFIASGIFIGTGQRIEVPSLDWLDLVAVEGRGEVDEVRYGPLGGGYRDLRIPSGDLQLIWPPPKHGPSALPDLNPPDGDGYMPLYSAALWIATEAGTRKFDPADREAWRPAFDGLLAAIASERVRVTGLVDGVRELIPGHRFAGCEVDYPHSEPPDDLVFSDRMHLRSYPFVDEERWRKGFDDSPVSRRKAFVTQLMVEKGDVRERWPFSLRAEALSSGLPGRPVKSKHLIEDEFKRRAEGGCLAATLQGEAEALLEWLVATYPQHARPTVDTIRNNIRHAYRQLKSRT